MFYYWFEDLFSSISSSTFSTVSGLIIIIINCDGINDCNGRNSIESDIYFQAIARYFIFSVSPAAKKKPIKKTQRFFYIDYRFRGVSQKEKKYLLLLRLLLRFSVFGMANEETTMTI